MDTEDFAGVGVGDDPMPPRVSWLAMALGTSESRRNRQAHRYPAAMALASVIPAEASWGEVNSTDGNGGVVDSLVVTQGVVRGDLPSPRGDVHVLGHVGDVTGGEHSRVRGPLLLVYDDEAALVGRDTRSRKVEPFGAQGATGGNEDTFTGRVLPVAGRHLDQALVLGDRGCAVADDADPLGQEGLAELG